MYDAQQLTAGRALADVLDWGSPEFHEAISNISDGQAWAGKIAIARSGDKGDGSNVGVFVTNG